MEVMGSYCPNGSNAYSVNAFFFYNFEYLIGLGVIFFADKSTVTNLLPQMLQHTSLELRYLSLSCVKNLAHSKIFEQKGLNFILFISVH